MKVAVCAFMRFSGKKFEFKPLYSGGVLWVNGPWDEGVVLDIDGLQYLPKEIPCCLDHDRTAVVGRQMPRIEQVSGKKQISASGEFLDTPAAYYVLREFKGKKLRWEGSISTDDFVLELDTEVYPKGQRVCVNGRTFLGPIRVVRRWKLEEGSFVKRGGDTYTQAVIHAMAIVPKEEKMTEELRQYIVACGYDPDTVSPEQLTIFERCYAQACERIEAEAAAEEKESSGEDPAQAEAPSEKLEEKPRGEPKPISEEKENVAAEGCDEEEKKEMGKVSATNSVARRMGTGKVSASHGAPNAMDVLTVAIMRNLGMFTEAQISAAGLSDNAVSDGLTRRYNGYSVKQMAIELLREQTGNIYRGTEDSFVEAFFTPAKVKASGFSSVSPLAIVGNVLNKVYYQGTQRIASVVDKIALTVWVDNLLEAKVTSYDVYGLPPDMAQDSELADMKIVGEDTTVTPSTSGAKLTLTRNMLLNNQIEGFASVLLKLGIKDKRKYEKRGIAKLLSVVGDGSSDFNTTIGNKITAAISLSAVNTAAAALASMEALGSKPDDKEFTECEGKYLLVPPALAATAYSLHAATNLVAQTAGGTIALANTYHQYEPLVSANMSAGACTNGSNTGWFLLADPSEAAILAVAKLRGAAEPHIQQLPPPSDIVGARWITYFDYGFGVLDHRAAVYSTGSGT